MPNRNRMLKGNKGKAVAAIAAAVTVVLIVFLVAWRFVNVMSAATPQ